MFATLLSIIGILFLIGAADGSDAGSFIVDDVEYTTISDTEVSLSAYKSTVTDFTVPDTVTDAESKTYIVKQIGNRAFYKNSNLTGITLSDNVTTIGGEAFYLCTNLTTVSFGTNLERINNSAFQGCSSITSLTIDTTMKYLGYYAFGSCTGLQTLSVNMQLSSSSTSVFQGCTSLRTLTIGASVDALNECMFNGCTNLTVINYNAIECADIPDGKQVFNSAGSSGAGITVNFGDTVEKIPENLLSCSNIKLLTVNIGSNVSDIGTHCFTKNNTLTTITVSSYNNSFSSQDGMLYDKGKTELIACPRSNPVENYVASSTLTAISNDAFLLNSSLKTVTIGSNVSEIGARALSGKAVSDIILSSNSHFTLVDGALYDSSVTRLIQMPACKTITGGVYTIPGTVTTIDPYAFYNCTSLVSITIPAGVTSIGEWAFAGCSYVTSLYYNAANAADFGIYSHTFYALGRSASIGVTVYFGDTVEYVPSYFFRDTSYAPNIKHISIGSGLSSIGYGAFSSMYYLEDFTVSSENRYFSEFHGSLVSKDTTIYYKNAGTDYTLPSNIVRFSDYSFENTKVTSVVIPSTVTAIGDYAFASCRSLSTVTISGNVSEMGINVFYYCTSLDTVTISEGTTEIGDYAFQYSNVRTISFPSTLTSIGGYAFQYCNCLTSVTIPSGVTYIGYCAFDQCKMLGDVTYLAEDCTTVTYAFSRIGESATSVSATIGSSVKNIPDGLFRISYYLDSVTISEGVESIGDYSFYDCRELTEVTIPSTVTYIGNSAFYNCRNVSVLNYNAANASSVSNPFTSLGADVSSGITVNIGDTVESLPNSIFWNDGSYKTWIASITFGTGLKNIGDKAFYKQTLLTSVVFNSEIESIGNMAFSYCTGLTSFTFPQTLSSLGYEVLSNCYNISTVNYNAVSCADIANRMTFYNCGKDAAGGLSVIISDDVKRIPAYLFYMGDNTYYYSSITMGQNVEEVGAYAFYKIKLGTSLELPDSIKTIGQYAYAYRDFTEIDLPSSLETLGKGCFSYWSNLTTVKINSDIQNVEAGAFFNSGISETSEVTVVIDSSVTAIADNMFYRGAEYNWTQIKAISFGSNITSIGASAFKYIRSLTSVTFSEGLKTVGDDAFYSTRMTSLELPSTVETIGDYAFAYNSNTIKTFGGIPSNVTSIGDYAFAGSIGKQTSMPLSLSPTSTLTIGDYAFKSCYFTSVTIGAGITVISDGAFNDVRYMTSLSLTNGLTKIGDDAFSGCQALTSVTIPSSVTYLGPAAFKNCSALSALTIDDSALYISDEAFSSCALGNVDLGDNVSGIGISAFYNCVSLKTMTIPSSVTAIGSSAFNNCSAMESVTFSEGLLSIGDLSFGNCPKITSVAIPNSVTSVGDNAFKDCSALQTAEIGTGMKTIGKGIFSNCTNLGSFTFKAASCNDLTADSEIFYGCITDMSVTFTGTVERVPANLLRCETIGYEPHIISLTLSSNITEIGDYAFYNMKYISSLTIPSGVLTIGNHSFESCTSLTTLSIGETVTSIGDSAFSGCTELSGISIPDSVRSVGCSAFDGCSSAQSIRVGSDVSSIGDSAFSGCTSVTNIYYHAASCADVNESGAVFYDVGRSGTGADLFIGDSVTRIPANLFYVSDEAHSPLLNAVTIGKNVTEIGQNAFRNCVAITSIDYRATSCSNLSANSRAFVRAGKNNNMTVNISDDVQAIPSYLFCSDDTEGNVYVSSATVGSAVRSIGDHSFYKNVNLSTVSLPAQLETIGQYSFYGCGIASIDATGNVTSIGESAFENCGSLTTVDIGLCVVNIGDRAFRNCVSLKTVTYEPTAEDCIVGANIFSNAGTSGNGITLTISDKVRVIPSGIFYVSGTDEVASKLYKIYGGALLETIGSNAFNGCTYLDSITINSSLETIGDMAFAGSGLKNITLPSTLETLGEGAFAECTRFMEVVFNCTLTEIQPNTFKGTALTYVDLPSGLTLVGTSAFENCVQMINVTFPDSLTTIGNSAFKNSGIQILTLQNSVTEIYDNAFENCIGLNDVTLNTGLVSIGDSAFKGCQNISNIVISSTVTHIGDYAFANTFYLSSLTYNAVSVDDITADSNIFYKASSLSDISDVVIGSSVSVIPAYLFYVDPDLSSSPKIKSVSMHDGATEIGAHAFDNCTELQTVKMNADSSNNDGQKHGTIRTIGSYAFNYCYNLEQVDLADDTISIKDHAFYMCSGLSSITLPEYLIEIGEEAFREDTSLKSVTNRSVLPIKSASESYGYVAYYVDHFEGDAVSYNLLDDYDVIYNATSTVCMITSYKGSATTVSLPNTLKIFNVPYTLIGVDSDAFKDNTTIEEILFSGENVLIKCNAFSGCTNLSTMTLSSELLYIDPDAFPSAEFYDSDKITRLSTDSELGGYVYSGALDGKFYRNHYSVRYTIDGELYGDVEVYTPETEVTLREKGVKEGHTVGNWNVSETVTGGKFTMPFNNVSVYATASVNQYTISFVDSDGKTPLPKVKSITQYYGTEVTAPANPAKTGYTFVCWTYNGEPYEFTTMPAMNIKLAAQWSINSYNVIYQLDRVNLFVDTYEYNATVTIREQYTKEGYTVSQWNVPSALINNQYKMLGYDIQITATSTVNTYEISYYVDGELVDRDSSPYGQIVTLADKPTKEGYTVTDWVIPQGVIVTDREFQMPAFDVTFTATSTINTYYVIYYINDIEVFRDGYEYQQPYTIRDKYEMEGYTVSEWDREGTYVMQDYDVDVNATAEVNHYTITFDSNGGTDVPEITQDYGTVVIKPDDPNRIGHSLKYWTLDGEEYVFTTMPARDLTLVAEWSINQYTITFDSNGGTYVEPITQDYGSTVRPPNDPKLEGHSLKCWKENGFEYVFDKMPDYDVTLVAEWEVVEFDIYYTVGETLIEKTECLYGGTVTLIDRPVIKGYTIGDWVVPSGIIVTEGTFIMPAYDVYITATQTANYYTITFDSNGGTPVEPITQQYLTPVTKPEDPYLEGQHLACWTLHGDEYTFDLMPNEDITLTAEWAPNEYKVQYYVGGELVIEELADYNSVVVVKDRYEKEGYDVDAWTWDHSAIVVVSGYFYMPAYDVRFDATQTVRSHNVTYYFDSEEYGETTVHDYGTEVTLMDKPLKTGYSVTDWTLEPAVVDNKFIMPDSDVVIISVSTINYYNVIYKVDGETVDTLGYKYGSTVTIAEKYQKTGYAVTDWIIPEGLVVVDRKFTLPDYDVTFNATSTMRQYTLIYMVDGEQSGETEHYNYGDQVTMRAKYVKEGYSVKSWSYPSSVRPISGVFSMPAEDVVISTTTTVNEYRVTYYVDSKYQYYDKIAYGTTVTMRAKATIEGYTVTDWVGPKTLVITDRQFVMPAYDVELDAYSSINTYSVTYTVDGEQVGEKEYYVYDKVVQLRDRYEKTGYTVSPWTCPEPVTYGSFNVPAYDMVITATSSVNHYTVRYTIDGDYYKSYIYDYGTEVTLLDKYEIIGYDTTDWSIPSGVTVVDRKFTMIDSDVVFNCTTTVKSYKVYYYVGDELKYTDKADYGSTVYIRTKYKTTGYTADEWSIRGVGPEISSNKSFVMPAYDVSLETSLTINTHKVIYKVDGYQVGDVEYYQYDALVTVREQYVKEGYTVEPWSKTGTFNMPDYDMTISTTSKVNKHYVTYYVDGVMISSTQYAYSSNVQLQDEYQKTGYTVTAWQLSEPVKNNRFVMPDYDVSITATTSINSYTITFDSNGGTEVEPITAVYNSEVKAPANPTKVGYEFNTWVYNNKQYTFDVMPAENITLKASWNAVKYNVIYKVNGVVVDTIQYKYMDVVVVKDTYVKPGYTVTPWDITDTFFMPAEDVVIRATSKINRYTITFDSDGGSDVSPITKYYGESIYKPNDPTKYGHTFLYWMKDGIQYEFTSMPAENITLTAVWEPNLHYVNYLVDDELKFKDEARYGETVTVREKYVKEGYRVTDWDITGTFVMDDMDVTIRATSVLNTHKVTYLVDGEQIGDIEEYSSNTKVEIRDRYVKTGYTVTKWTVTRIDTGDTVPTSSNTFLMPDTDVNVNATSKINKYTMNFNTNGGSYIPSVKAEYGTFIERPDDPTRDGYIFSEWQWNGTSYEITTMPAENVTLNSIWIRDIQETDVYTSGTTNIIEATTESVIISKNACDALASNSKVTLNINSVSMTMSSSSFKKMYNGGELSITIVRSTGLTNEKALAKLGQYDLETVKTALLLSITITGKGSTSDLGDITIKVPYTLADSKAAGDLASYFVSEGGDFSRVTSSYTSDGYMQLTVDHCSEFIVCEHALFIEKTNTGSSDSNAMQFALITIGIIAAGLAVAGLMYYYFRRPSY